MSHDYKDQLRSIGDEVFSKPSPRALPKDALVVGEDPETGAPVYFAAGDLNKHLQVMGGSDTGKSYFLRRLAHQLLWRKKHCNEGFSIIDPHGTLARYVRDLIATDAPEFAHETVFLDLKQAQRVVVYNPLSRVGDARYLAQCVTEAILKACGNDVAEKPQIQRTLVRLGQALKETGGVLTDAHFLLYRSPEDRAVQEAVLQRLPRRTPLYSFWHDLMRKSGSAVDFYTVGALNRIEQLVEPLPLRRMLGVGAPHASLDFSALLDRGGIALFDLSRAETGVSIHGQMILAALLCQEYYQELDRREGDGDAVPHTLILDEFGDYASADFARALTSGRKFNMRCVFSHQNLSQLVWDDDRALIETVLAIPNKAIFGRLSPNDAKVMAEDLFFALLNPLEVKYWHEEIHWDPKPTLVTTRSGSRTHSEGESEGESDVASDGWSDGGSTVVDPERQVAIEATSWQRSAAQARGLSRSVQSSDSWTESYQEQWVTFHEKRVSRRPEFKSLEEQLHDYARLLKGQSKQRCVVGRVDQLPRQCKVANVSETELDREDRQRFLEDLYRRVPRIYLTPTEADAFIQEREQKLLDAAGDVEDEVT